MYKTLILTISDKGSRGERIDTAGPAVKEMLEKDCFQITAIQIISDDSDQIKDALIKAADSSEVDLILTVGGTGFAPRDNTPEATIAVCDRLVPGIPEAMRRESSKYTQRSMLSRAAAGIRNNCLIVNLPGSEKAARENLSAVLDTLPHGLDMLLQNRGECAATSDH